MIPKKVNDRLLELGLQRKLINIDVVIFTLVLIILGITVGVLNIN
jgi:hypothetical protein